MYEDVMLTDLSRRLYEAQRFYNHTVNHAMNVSLNLFLDEYSTLLHFCQSIGEMDALLGFANLADSVPPSSGIEFSRPRFCRENMDSPRLFLRDGWNPQLSGHSPQIVPNTIHIGGSASTALIISGANSGGKTSVLKMTAIATIMAQIGCYVPCSDSLICPVSRILTRLGARDRLSAGESTFAIEMKEASAILNQADANSLAIIDELGRGTSPKEGQAIAWATLNTLASICRTMLATHYHEINDYFEFDVRVGRHHMPVSSDETRFQLRPGPEPDMSSGGILCACDAGLPVDVLKRAEQISKTIHMQLKGAQMSPPMSAILACLGCIGGSCVSCSGIRALQRKIPFLLGSCSVAAR